MLSEEALLLVVAFAVLAFVIVALLEAIWPTRRRGSRHRVGRRSGRPLAALDANALAVPSPPAASSAPPPDALIIADPSAAEPTGIVERGGSPLAPAAQTGHAGAAVDLGQARPRPWAASVRQVAALIQRQEFAAARDQVRDALAEPELPADDQDALLELLTAAYSGEVGQLTAHAIRVMQEAHEREALAALEQAEALLASAPDLALAAARRDEVERRLWWAYTKLGLRRVEAGAFDEAIEPLVHALRFDAVDPDRQQETRAVLAQALIGMADGRAAAIEALAREGRREAALEAARRFRARLDDGLALGLTPEDLAPALDRARIIVEQVAPGGGRRR